MKILNKTLFLLVSILILQAGCNIPVTVKSSTADKVIINAQPDYFSGAYTRAHEECQKYEKKAQYTPDANVSLDELAFDCVGGPAEEEVIAEPEETTAEPEEEVAPE